MDFLSDKPGDRFNPRPSILPGARGPRVGGGPKSGVSGRRFGRARGDSRGSFRLEWLRIEFWRHPRSLFSKPTLELRRLAPARGGGIRWILGVPRLVICRTLPPAGHLTDPPRWSSRGCAVDQSPLSPRSPGSPGGPGGGGWRSPGSPGGPGGGGWRSAGSLGGLGGGGWRSPGSPQALAGAPGGRPALGYSSRVGGEFGPGYSSRVGGEFGPGCSSRVGGEFGPGYSSRVGRTGGGEGPSAIGTVLSARRRF